MTTPEVKKVLVYRIRSKKTGQHSMGGGDVSWTANGKIWKGQGPLSNHFAQLTRTGKKQYENHQAEVVTYVLAETEVAVRPVMELIAEADARREAREAKSHAAHHRAKIARLEKELAHHRAKVALK